LVSKSRFDAVFRKRFHVFRNERKFFRFVVHERVIVADVTKWYRTIQ
jgi:hypothetical protein